MAAALWQHALGSSRKCGNDWKLWADRPAEFQRERMQEFRMRANANDVFPISDATAAQWASHEVSVCKGGGERLRETRPCKPATRI